MKTSTKHQVSKGKTNPKKTPTKVSNTVRGPSDSKLRSDARKEDMGKM